MNKIYTRFKLIFKKITGKIAFFPSLIGVAGLFFAFAMLSLEMMGVTNFLVEYVPEIIISDADTIRVLLSTFVGGIISLMVFSFSMVMLLLNQASTSFSPRILPGLISNKRHQIVLGVYLGTIVYDVIILLSIDPMKGKDDLPGFSVLISILMVILTLGLFIYFIHSISQAIQINNITNNIHRKAKNRLESLLSSKQMGEKSDKVLETSDWEAYELEKTGTLGDVAFDALCRFCTENDLQIDILVAKGKFVLRGISVFRASKELSEEQLRVVQSYFEFTRSEIVEDNYVLGFKQLTEIAVKAMSPGINDPGTAITCIDYMTELFALLLPKNDVGFIYGENGEILVQIQTITFEEIMYFSYASLRQYSKSDFIVMLKMLNSLYFLMRTQGCETDERSIIVQQTTLILEDAEQNIGNSSDLARLKVLGQKIKDYATECSASEEEE